MVDNHLLRAFRDARQFKASHGFRPAREALEQARRVIWTQVWGGKGPQGGYSSPWRRGPSDFGGVPSDSVRWVEAAESNGFRVVGEAHKILSLNHTGWYADSFQDSVYVGAVLQLPGRKGEARYVAAYADPDNDGAYRVDMTIWEESRRDGSRWDSPSDIDACRGAARAADSLAEQQAEEARDYDSAWQAGAQWRDLKDGEAAERRKALKLASEARALRARVGADEAPTVCAVLRSQIRAAWESITKSRGEREELAQGNREGFWFYPSEDLKGAFCEGAGLEAFPA